MVSQPLVPEIAATGAPEIAATGAPEIAATGASAASTQPDLGVFV